MHGLPESWAPVGGPRRGGLEAESSWAVQALPGWALPERNCPAGPRSSAWELGSCVHDVCGPEQVCACVRCVVLHACVCPGRGIPVARDRGL